MKVLFARAGLADVPVYVVSNRTSPAADAVIQGMGGSRRIVVPSPLAAASTPAELLYDVAYELGDVRERAALWIALIEAGIVIVGATIAVAIADRIGFRRDDDELSRLALVGALLAVVYLGAVPFRNIAVRAFAMRDDNYAVSLTGDRAAAVRSIVRATDQRMDEVCPDINAMLFLDTRPAPGARFAAINGVANGCP
jgi:Zn-dependent protease with chaperone function